MQSLDILFFGVRMLFQIFSVVNAGRLFFLVSTSNPLMITMIVSYQDTHNSLNGYVHILQELTNRSCRYTGIDQYSMIFMTHIITISTAPAAKTAKIQFHQYLVHWGQRYISMLEKQCNLKSGNQSKHIPQGRQVYIRYLKPILQRLKLFATVIHSNTKSERSIYC